jgi:hypothetical protein
VTEYVSGELGAKIKAIICEWWKVVGAGTDNYLESSTIYERLTGEGVEVPDHAMSEILVELAQGGQIKLTMEQQTQPRSPQIRQHVHTQSRTGLMFVTPSRPSGQPTSVHAARA